MSNNRIPHYRDTSWRTVKGWFSSHESHVNALLRAQERLFDHYKERMVPSGAVEQRSVSFVESFLDEYHAAYERHSKALTYTPQQLETAFAHVFKAINEHDWLPRMHILYDLLRLEADTAHPVYAHDMLRIASEEIAGLRQPANGKGVCFAASVSRAMPRTPSESAAIRQASEAIGVQPHLLDGLVTFRNEVEQFYVGLQHVQRDRFDEQRNYLYGR